MNRLWLTDKLPDTSALRQSLLRQLTAPWFAPRPMRQWFRRTFTQPAIWQLNRRSVAGGVAVGLFISWIPVPIQMLFAAIFAAVLRVHVPVSVVMVWFTNPLTFAPLLYAAWCAGSMILGEPALAEPLNFHPHSIVSNAWQIWPTLLTGMLFCACVSAVVGFYMTLTLWRLYAVRRWRKRQLRVSRCHGAQRRAVKPLKIDSHG